MKYHKEHLFFFIFLIYLDNIPLQNYRNKVLSSFVPLHLPNYSEFLCTKVSKVYIYYDLKLIFYRTWHFKIISLSMNRSNFLTLL